MPLFENPWMISRGFCFYTNFSSKNLFPFRSAAADKPNSADGTTVTRGRVPRRFTFGMDIRRFKSCFAILNQRLSHMSMPLFENPWMISRGFCFYTNFISKNLFPFRSAAADKPYSADGTTVTRGRVPRRFTFGMDIRRFKSHFTILNQRLSHMSMPLFENPWMISRGFCFYTNFISKNLFPFRSAAADKPLQRRWYYGNTWESPEAFHFRDGYP
jgi:hypothetical protein